MRFSLLQRVFLDFEKECLYSIKNTIIFAKITQTHKTILDCFMTDCVSKSLEIKERHLQLRHS